ncbi:hypothetical protein HNR75_000801 [Tolumonas osonensis]|uniref:DUF4867 family protein n=2 Tax=Tolumonas osonensis TaxID=675874 RepID=A0A841GAG3_9GAMM|nr:hypothetical protein [Tolumonas osonensis]
MNIVSVLDEKFKCYGSVLNGYNFDEIIKYSLINIQLPEFGNLYEPAIPAISEFEEIKNIKSKVYGELPIQAGYVTGHNQSLTGLEYHQGSETIIAITDLILILGKRQDLIDDCFLSEKAEVFFVNAGQAVELYGTTLHYTPCKTSLEPFLAVVVLPDGTNRPLSEKRNESLLFKKNKWFITHTSEKEKVKNGAFPGLLGKIIKIKI